MSVCGVVDRKIGPCRKVRAMKLDGQEAGRERQGQVTYSLLCRNQSAQPDHSLWLTGLLGCDAHCLTQ
jgi:hypothetical protein